MHLWGLLLVLGKFGPGPIGTRSGPDQTQRSRSWSGIFPKIQDCSVSGLGIPILPKTIQTQSGLDHITVTYIKNMLIFHF